MQLPCCTLLWNLLYIKVVPILSLWIKSKRVSIQISFHLGTSVACSFFKFLSVHQALWGCYDWPRWPTCFYLSLTYKNQDTIPIGLLVNWWFACDVMAAILVDRNSKIFLLREFTATFMQTLWTNFLLICPPIWWQFKPPIGGLNYRQVGGKNKRKFAHIVCIKMEVNSQRRKILLFHTTNMAVMT